MASHDIMTIAVTDDIILFIPRPHCNPDFSAFTECEHRGGGKVWEANVYIIVNKQRKVPDRKKTEHHQ